MRNPMKKDSSNQKQMQIKRAMLVAALLANIAVCSSPSVAAQPVAGHDKQVRWQYTPSWKVQGDVIDMAHSLDDKRIFFLTSDQKVRIYSAEGKLLGSVPVAPQVAHIDISPIGDKLYLFDRSKNEFSSISLAFQRTIDTTDAPAKGAENAPVSIVVFTDFECPYCKKLPPILEQVEKNNPGKVRIFFKNMPLISIHKMAEGAARAAIAAQKQEKFWPYHDKLFAADKLSPQTLQQFAKELGLDMKKFDQDMQAQETTNALQKDMYDARNAGVEGTPTIFINGWALGNRSVEGFQEMIDTLVAEKQQ